MATDNTTQDSRETLSVFQSNLPLETKLERARTELLDLSARNRLLNMPRSGKSARILQVVNEQSAEIHRFLVRENKPMVFRPGRLTDDPAQGDVDEETGAVTEMAQPEEETVNDDGTLSRHVDNKLQTQLTPAGLQKRLLDLYYDARTLEEEQGVNILFLALGALKWIDPNNKENIRYAPLVLVPVSLERGNAGERFKLRWRQEEAASNLSLELYLDRVHGLKMPPFDGGDDFDFSAYANDVAEAVATKEGWSVNPDDITIGFFSFAKFLMYRDLDPDVWPQRAKISEHSLIRSLVSDGFSSYDDLIPENSRLDQHLAPSDMLHIVDSDSSQTLAIHEVRRNRNIIIQGPPGTGKSQTIANIVASAVADGKTVLFVAEKMAALEVVKRRLDMAGVGDACIELHSNKANKRAVLQELKRTWDLGAPTGELPNALDLRLAEVRDRLNEHAERMHRPHGAARFTPYEIVGHLTRLKQNGQSPNDIRLVTPEKWTSDDLGQRFKVLSELAERISEMGLPAEYVWRGIGIDTILPPDVDRLVLRLRSIAEQLEKMRQECAVVSASLETSPADSASSFAEHVLLVQRIASAPVLPPEALGSSHWHSKPTEILALLDAGVEYAGVAENLKAHLKPHAWSKDLSSTQVLADLPSGFSIESFEHAGLLSRLGPQLLDEAEGLAQALGQSPPTTLAAIDLTVQIAERVAKAPPASSEALAAPSWDNGVDRAKDLANAVATLGSSRVRIDGKLSDAAWSIDFRQARTTFAAFGTGFFRILSGDWRRANRLIRSVLTDFQTPLPEILLLLDALTKGQAALKTIQEEDLFGREVFGTDWRGDKSVPSPLLALTDWMSSIRSLGPEPRIIAARRPDQSEVQDRARRVRALLMEARAPLLALWTEVGQGTATWFSSALSLEKAPLAEAANRLTHIFAAHLLCRDIMVAVPSDLQDCRLVLNNLARAQALLKIVSDGDETGCAAFGSEWQSTFSNWSTLRTAADWITANLDIHMLASRVCDRSTLLEHTTSVAALGAAAFESFCSMLDELKCDRIQALGGEKPEVLSLTHLASRISSWLSSAELLSIWVAYRNCAERGRALGMGEVVDRLHDGRLQPREAHANFEMSYYEAVFSDLAKAQPEVARFDGALHARTVNDFADFDRQRIRASAVEVVRAHHRKIPPTNGGVVGPLGVLRSELVRRRGHMPIRQLIQRAAPAVQALKPVFMMSPLSIAQFLPPGALTFDLVVMDEASQIQPVDALGAIARSHQVVVVGDPQQLPPTAFFSKMTGDAAEEEEEGAKLGDIESILGLFTARGLPMRLLRWHYRSRHQSLIAVSNKQFYENKLFIVPSPYTAEAGMGLRFTFVEDGIFEAGTTRTNPIEAKIVARAVVAHAIQNPKLSLGVAAFSAAQRRAIQNQVEILRRQLPPEHEAFFQAHPSEPFFVKNLENVQGDERDVIFISVGYGPTAPGQKPPMRFGPLGTEGGERRLNVLISRAKRRCEVFSSMTDEDIDLDFASTPSRKGVLAFKLFLHFARTGRMAMAETTGRDHDSIFEEQVAKALRARGHQVHTQIGIAGFFVDLAISDADHPGRFVLGVECDGASYHDSRSARDRDRLRQTVLEDNGWIIHRIWSTDWFKRPREQLYRVEAAIAAAKAELVERGNRERAATPTSPAAIDRELNLTDADSDLDAIPYKEASITKPQHLSDELHEAPTGILVTMAEEVVRIEGPVHVDEIVSRIREAWNLKRAGARIQGTVEKAIATAVRQQRLAKDGKFLSVPGAGVKVRDRSDVQSSTLRRPEVLPPTELRQAALQIVASNFGATDDQIIQAISRALGFKATSPTLRSVIQKAIDSGVTEQLFKRQDDLVILGSAAPEDLVINRKTPIEQLVAEGEHEHLEFKQTLRWDVGQNRHNKALEEVVVKSIASFANGNGGTLLIGVKDDGGIVGLEPDFDILGGNRDKFELHLTNLMNKHFGQAFCARKVRVTFPVVRDIQICQVEVRRAVRPIFVTTSDKRGVQAERFFVRSGNSSQELSPRQVAEYVDERFGKS